MVYVLPSSLVPRRGKPGDEVRIYTISCLCDSNVLLPSHEKSKTKRTVYCLGAVNLALILFTSTFSVFTCPVAVWAVWEVRTPALPVLPAVI